MRQEVKRSVPKARSRREAMRYGSHASTEQERRSGLRSGSAPKQRPRGTGPPRPAPGQPRQPGTGHSCRGGPHRHRQVRRARRRLRSREQAPWGRRTLKQPGLEAGPGLCNRSRRTGGQRRGAAATAPGFLGHRLPRSAVYATFRSGRLCGLRCLLGPPRARCSPGSAQDRPPHREHVVLSRHALGLLWLTPPRSRRAGLGHGGPRLELAKQMPSGCDLLLNRGITKSGGDQAWLT